MDKVCAVGTRSEPFCGSTRDAKIRQMEIRALLFTTVVLPIGLYFWTVYFQQELGTPGLTAVLLNWKRLDNNVRILAELCKLDTITQIRVWNNNAGIKLHFGVCNVEAILLFQ